MRVRLRAFRVRPEHGCGEWDVGAAQEQTVRGEDGEQAHRSSTQDAFSGRCYSAEPGCWLHATESTRQQEEFWSRQTHCCTQSTADLWCVQGHSERAGREAVATDSPQRRQRVQHAWWLDRSRHAGRGAADRALHDDVRTLAVSWQSSEWAGRQLLARKLWRGVRGWAKICPRANVRRSERRQMRYQG